MSSLGRLLVSLSILAASCVAKPLLEQVRQSPELTVTLGVQEEARKLEKELDAAQLIETTKLNFERGPEDVRVHVGETIELSCEVVSTPGAVIYWSHNGVRLDEAIEGNLYEKVLNAGRKTIATAIMDSKLRIPCATKHHRGQYTCHAANGHQNVEMSAHVSVAGSSKEACEADQAPYIHMWMSGRFEAIGNAVILTCRAKGENVQISWYNSEKELLNHQQGFHVLPNGDLLIPKAAWNAMDEYKCVASNEFGEDRESTFFYPTDESKDSSKKSQKDD